VDLLSILKEAVSVARMCIFDNLDISSEYAIDENLQLTKSLILDIKAEEKIIEVLQSSGFYFDILTEEKGYIKSPKNPEYLAIVDPIDGSTNLKRGIPLVSTGIALVPYQQRMTSDDIEISMITSVFTNETYIGIKGEGVTRNGKRVNIAKPTHVEKAIISYNTRSSFTREFSERTLRIIRSIHDLRRTASPLLDLCWTAAGSLDATVDLRNTLPIFHLSGTHMVTEAGGCVINATGNHFCSTLDSNQIMSFVAASNEKLARQILGEFSYAE